MRKTNKYWITEYLSKLVGRYGNHVRSVLLKTVGGEVAPFF